MSDRPRVTVPLTYPIQAHGETVTELSLRRINAGDLRVIGAAGGQVGGTHATLTFISRLAGIPPSSVDQLDAADVTALGEVIVDFLGKSPATGGAP